MKVRALHYAIARPVLVDIARGACQSVIDDDAPAPDTGEPIYVAPGLVDLQVNGYLGRDFNRAPLTPDAVADTTRLLWRHGTTTYFPTVITNSVDAIARAAADIAAACRSDADVAAGVGGIHLEGPFISPEDGARGAHASEFVRPPDWDLFRRWQDAAGGRIRIITLSPEWPGSTAFIEQCVTAGVVVSIGHTSAKPEQIATAVAAGARMSTHLGNGAHLMLPRHPNYLWEQLAQDDLWACMIGDGFHLPDQVLKVILRVKGARTLLVSDAVALAGLPAGAYTQPVGGDVILTPEGRLHLASNPGLLAGSARMLPHHVGHLVERDLATLGQAWDMASVRPAELLKLPPAQGLTAGAPADLVLFRYGKGGPQIMQTIKNGRVVFTDEQWNQGG